jgi:hypothetical protein
LNRQAGRVRELEAELTGLMNQAGVEADIGRWNQEEVAGLEIR